jgi:chromosome segregation ATPase
MTRNNNGGGDRDALRADIQQTRAELGETVEALAAKADVKARLKDSAAQAKEDVKARLKGTATHTKDLVRGQAGQLKGTAAHTKDAAREQAEYSASTVRESVQDAGRVARRYPVAWAAIGAGALAVLVVVLVVRGRRR